MARTPTQKEIAAFLIGHGIVDFVSGGRLTKAERNALWKVVKKLGPPVARGTGMALGSVAIPAAARAAPVALPALAGLQAYEMGKRDAERIRTGEMSLAEGLQTYPNPVFINPTFAEQVGVTGPASEIDLFTPIARARKKVSSYSKAVKAGMNAVKKSKFDGKPGKIRNPKKTFSTVNKVVSAVNKGKKVPSKGVRGTIARAARKILPRRKK
jgi:hypothetical protein